MRSITLAPAARLVLALLASLALVATSLLAAASPARAVGPALTVTSPSGAIAASEGATLTVQGTGYEGALAQDGVYLIFTSSDLWQPGSTPSSGIHVTETFVSKFTFNGEGFTTTLAVPAGVLDESKSYGVGSFCAHGCSVNDRSLDAWTPVDVDFGSDEGDGGDGGDGDGDGGDDSPPVTTPALTVSKTAGIDAAGETLTLSGAGYNPAQPMYLIVCHDVPLSKVSFGFASGCIAGSKQITNDPTTPTMVKLEDDGTFTTTFTISRNPEFTGGTALYTLANHTAMGDRSQDAKQSISFTPLLTVSKATGLDASGETITVSGLGYNPAQPMYLIVCHDVPLSEVSFGFASGCIAGSKQITNDPTTPTMVKLEDDGTFTTTFTISRNPEFTGGTALYTLANHTAMGDRSQDARRAVTFAGAPDPGGPGGGDPGTDDPGTGDPGTPAAGAALSLSPSTLNPNVANTLTVSGSGYTGAGAANGVYVSLGLSSLWRPGQVPTESDWVRTLHVSPGQLSGGRFSTTIALPAGTLELGGSYGVATFAAHSLSLTDRTLDAWAPLTLSTVGVTTATRSGEPAATPPATAGATSDETQFVEGKEYTFTADGFKPDETGILAVIYSQPTVLAEDLTADAAGTVSWTGNLPRGLTGEHTFTFQGSVDRGIVLQIATAEVVGCTADGAEIHWGFKESFRAYIDGAIANGEWTTAGGVGYETPLFTWADGTGGYDVETGDADLAFSGSVRFTGHGGALDTTIANPRIVVDGDRAVLLLDVSGTTQDGTPISGVGVEFAELDFADAERAGGGDLVAFTGIQAVLTEAGAAAFGTYPAGEALDAIDLRITVDPACAEPTTTIDESESAIDAENASGVVAWTWILLAILVATAVAITVAILVRRARRV